MTAHLFRALGLALALLLAGCSSMGGIAPAPGGGSSGGARQLDYTNDNLANLIFALDLPDGVQPTAAGISFSYDANDEKAPDYLDTQLVRGDAEAAMGSLPAPAAGRSYHVFVLSDPARERIRAIQNFVRVQQKKLLPLVNIVPRLCVSGAVDKARTTYDIRVVLPGRGALVPIIAGETLAGLETRSATIPACG
jgi:uncharacterized protein YceK